MVAFLLFAVFALFCAIFAPWIIPFAILVVASSDPSLTTTFTDVTWSKILLTAGVGRVIFDLVGRESRQSAVEFFKGAGALWGAFIAWSALSILWATFRGDAVHETFKYVEYLAAAFIAAFYSAQRRSIWFAVSWFSIVGLVAVIQVAHGGISDPLTDEKIRRASALLAGPNQASGYLEVGVALALSVYLARPGRKWWVPILPMLGVVATLSRGGFGAIVAMLTTSFSVAGRGRHLWTYAVGALAAASALFFLANPARFASSLNPGGEVAVTQRGALWTSALRMSASHPFLGIGSGNYPRLYASYSEPGPSFYLRTHANNLYLNTLAELGAVGLLILLAFLCACGLQGWRAFSHGDKVRGLALLLLAVGVAAHGFVDDVLYYPSVGLALFVSLGLCLKANAPQQTSKGLKPLNVLCLAIAAAVTPVFGYMLFLGASLLLAAGAPGAASPFAEAAVYVAPYSMDFRVLAGSLDLARGKYLHAAQRLEPLIGKDATMGRIAGDARSALGQSHQADLDWDKFIISVCSRKTDGWRYIEAETFAARRGRNELALQCMDKAIVQDGKQPVAYERAAAVALAQHFYKRASDYALGGLRIEPANGALRAEYIKALIGSGQLRAAANAKKPFEANYKAEVYATLGRAYFHLGQFAASRAAFDRSEHAAPLYGESAFESGVLALRRGRPELANKLFLRPGAITFVNAQAQRLIETKSWKAALPYLVSAAEQIPTAPFLLRTGGVILYRLGKAADAIPWLRRAALTQSALTTDRAQAYAELGDAYATMRRWQEAKTAFEESLSLKDNPGIPYVQIHLGTSLLFLHLGRKADESFRRALLDAPNDAGMYVAIIRQYLLQGRREDARLLLQKAQRRFPRNSTIAHMNV